MRPLHVARSAAALALIAALTGCGAARKTTATDVTPLDANQAYEVAQQVSLSMMLGSNVPMSMSTTQPWSRVTGARLRAAMPAMFDTTVTGDGITWQVSAHAYDADGVEQAEPDPMTTYRMTASSWLHGAWADEPGEVTLGSRSELDVRGVGSTWDSTATNGSRNDSLEVNFADDTLAVHWSSRCGGSIVNVIRNKPYDAHPYPASGAVNWSVDLDRSITSGSGSQSVHWIANATVTFDGTHLARLVVNGTHVFLLDLDTGDVTPVGA